MDYLLTKLETSIGELEQQYLKEQEFKDQVLSYHLMVIEGVIDLFGSEALHYVSRSIKRVGKKIEEGHSEYPKMLLLHGKKRFKKNDPKSEAYYFKAKDSVNKSFEQDHNNVKAAAYNDLGYIEYLRNNLDRAIYFMEKGLKAFNENGDELHLKYTLLSNQALFYEKLGMINKAKECLSILWSEYGKIDQAATKGRMYVVQARIYQYERDYESAKKCVRDGMVLARINKLRETAFALWTILGAIMRETGHNEVAEDSLKTAITIYDHLATDQERNIIQTHLEYARLLIDQRRWDEAQLHISLAISLCDKHDDALRKTKSMILHAELYMLQNQQLEAKIKLHEAKKIATEHNFNKLLLDILMHLANIHEEDEPDLFQQILAEKYAIEKAMRGGIHMLRSDEPGTS
ncbi:hypothetical protein SAMN05444392_10894 [Seinonella peptonophila]|uniref:Tetratricopeptide repeat-containing protein n=1 Tax=Seinonella peptonophila TaxID=112248 RepID=A0A1M4Z892_9BACL|nr:hypothetical protein [Seinonella peptonophila]SHF14168.1 hypothetical protein SAMN05444392_10894 [Seinonella peptonophila]